MIQTVLSAAKTEGVRQAIFARLVVALLAVAVAGFSGLDLPSARAQSGGIIGTGSPLAYPNLGVVGTVTEFGSVYVNQLHIKVRPDQLTNSQTGSKLQLGERVLVKVHKGSDGLRAVELRSLPKMEGQVGSDGQSLTLLNRRIVGALDGPSKAVTQNALAALRPGQWVSVDAIQIGDNDLLVGSVAVIAAPETVGLSGILSLQPGTGRFLVGGQPFVLSRLVTRGLPFMRTDILGRQVRVEGRMRADNVLEVITFEIDPVGEALKQAQPLDVELEGSYQRAGAELVISSDIARLRVPASQHPKVTADQGPALIKARLLPTGLLQILEVRPWQAASKPVIPKPQPRGYWYFDGTYWYYMPVVNAQRP